MLGQDNNKDIPTSHRNSIINYRLRNHIRRDMTHHTINPTDTHGIIVTLNLDALNVVKTTPLMSIPTTITVLTNLSSVPRTKLLNLRGCPFYKAAFKKTVPRVPSVNVLDSNTYYKTKSKLEDTKIQN